MQLYRQGVEITINWHSLDIDNQGIFFTDMNSYKFMRRDIQKNVNKTYLSKAN